jgi:hypothetical protein
MPHEKVPLNWLTADDDPEYWHKADSR